jgi:hypothetical protein
MKKSDEPASGAEGMELELPDWSGMDDSSARVGPDAAFQLCEKYQSGFPRPPPGGGCSVPKNAWWNSHSELICPRCQGPLISTGVSARCHDELGGKNRFNGLSAEKEKPLKRLMDEGAC